MCQSTHTTYSRYETVEVPLKYRLESIVLDPRLAARLAPREVRPGAGVAVATLTGNLVRNNRQEEEEKESIVEKVDTLPFPKGGEGHNGLWKQIGRLQLCLSLRLHLFLLSYFFWKTKKRHSFSFFSSSSSAFRSD